MKNYKFSQIYISGLSEPIFVFNTATPSTILRRIKKKLCERCAGKVSKNAIYSERSL